MFIECLPTLHFCHNMSTQLFHLYCKKHKVLKKLYLPCSCTCSPHNFRYSGQSWQSTRVSIALQKFQIGAIFWGYLLVFLSEIHQVDEEARCFPSTNQKTWVGPTAPPKHSVGWEKASSASLLVSDVSDVQGGPAHDVAAFLLTAQETCWRHFHACSRSLKHQNIYFCA